MSKPKPTAADLEAASLAMDAGFRDCVARLMGSNYCPDCDPGATDGCKGRRRAIAAAICEARAAGAAEVTGKRMAFLNGS